MEQHWRWLVGLQVKFNYGHHWHCVPCHIWCTYSQKILILSWRSIRRGPLYLSACLLGNLLGDCTITHPRIFSALLSFIFLLFFFSFFKLSHPEINDYHYSKQFHGSYWRWVSFTKPLITGGSSWQFLNFLRQILKFIRNPRGEESNALKFLPLVADEW